MKILKVNAVFGIDAIVLMGLQRLVYLAILFSLLIFASFFATVARVVDRAAHDDNYFSGVYVPDTKRASEVYAGSWLASRDRFLKNKDRIERISFLEQGSFAIVGRGVTAMTRDFFDFQVIHLSSTSNQIPKFGKPNFYHTLLKKMKRTAAALERSCMEHTSVEIDDRLRKQTLAIIPFSTRTASREPNDPTQEFQANIRRYFFQATFWSVKRYIDHVLITVSTAEDVEVLKTFNMPFWKVLDMSRVFNESAGIDDPKSTYLLPRETLVYVVQRLEEDKPESPWAKFKYVFYNEGDQVLHVRSESQLFDAMDKNDKPLAIAPHRMQTIALPKIYPQYVSLWKPKMVEKLLNVELITENETIAVGSCCDNGRFIFKECGNWWYNCEQWGLQNYTQWVRFGKFGFTMPLGTEHKARCSYSPQKRLCDLPPGCTSRTPTSADQLCPEIPNIEITYGWVPPPKTKRKKRD